MTMEDEFLALDAVVDRLAARYPAVSREQVEEVIREEHEALAGPIRDYIPILVERQAKDRIRGRLKHESYPRPAQAIGLPSNNPA